MSDRSVVVTGASGLLGRQVSRILSARGWEVYAVGRSPAGEHPSIHPVAVDLAIDWDRGLLPTRVDAVVHLAQSAAHRDFPAGAVDVFRVNIESTARLLDYAQHCGAGHFIFASSGGVYSPGPKPLSEQDPLRSPAALGYYLSSKVTSEMLVQSYRQYFQAIILRPFFMYGPGQRRDMLLPRLMDSVRGGKPVRLDGEHGLRINPVHVIDAAEATIRGLSLVNGGTFNIAGPTVHALREICEAMGRHLGTDPVFEHHPTHAEDLVADISLMQNALHSPERRLFESLSELE
jgi:UDP-glucose 4-epimerase